MWSSLLIFLATLALAIYNRNYGLGLVAVLGLSFWVSNRVTRKSRVEQRPRSRAEAITYVAARWRRYFWGLTVSGGVCGVLGALVVAAGVRRGYQPQVVFGVVLLLTCAALFILLFSLRRLLRAEGKGA